MGRIFCPFHALNAQDRLKVYAFPVEKKTSRKSKSERLELLVGL